MKTNLTAFLVSLFCIGTMSGSAQMAESGLNGLAMNSGKLITGNFGWNSYLYEEADGEQPSGTAGKVEKVTTQKVSKQLSAKAMEAIANEMAINAAANAIFIEPTVTDVYAKRMEEQAINHEYILRMMDSLNNPEMYASPILALGERHFAPPVESVNTGINRQKNNLTGAAMVSLNQSFVNAVVFGSFTYSENAEKYKQNLLDKGFDVEIIYAENVKKHRVVVKVDSKQSARSLVTKVRHSAMYRDVWVVGNQ